jgi:hypothetical protein
MRARKLDETEREALVDVLGRIQNAGTAVAAQCGVDVRVESDDRGKFPFVGFRLQGFSAAKDAPAEPGRDM